MAPVKKMKDAAQLRIMVERSDLESFREKHPEGMAEGFRALLKTEQRMEQTKALMGKAQSIVAPFGGLENIVVKIQEYIEKVKIPLTAIPLSFSSEPKDDTATRIASLASTNGIPAKDYAQHALNAWVKLVDTGWVNPNFSKNATSVPILVKN